MAKRESQHRAGGPKRWGSGLVAVLFLAAVALGRASAGEIWVEGEKPSHTSMKRHRWWYDKVHRGQLSGGDWISHFNEKVRGECSYKFAAPVAGTYVFWLRANPVKSSLDYRLGAASWRAVDFDSSVERKNIAADGKPDLRFIAWVKVGQVKLTKGENRIFFRTTSKNHYHGAIDCFVFTDKPFEPEGAVGQKSSPVAPDPGKWAFAPGRDKYSPKALLDLRSLNEKFAGEHGFIKLSKDGGDFVRGDGEPIRFWAVNSFVWRKGRDALADNARFLAKRGVNMVRWHGNIQAKTPDSDLDDIDEKARDQLWQYVAAMKAEGIYMTLSPYYAMPVKPQPKWHLPDGSKDMHGLLFFHPRLQAAYKAWLRALLVPRNPYTGIALKDEPAVAIIQFQNEDSLLFWTVSNIKGGDLPILQRLFGKWAARKYGSLAKASAAWKNFKADGDDFAAGRVGFRHVWEMTQPVVEPSGRAVRLADQTQFWTETMHGFNAEIRRYLRQDLGCKQLVNPGNWRTADEAKLGDAERWSYTAGEVLGINRYYTGGRHEGKHRGWAIVSGDRFSNRSVLFEPWNLSVALRQVAGHPIIIPEALWVPPLGYQSEGPFLVSVYQSLLGVDALYWFSMGEPQWRKPGSANGYLPSVGKWVAHSPGIMGNFPAAALICRNDCVRRGRCVIEEHRPLTDLWRRRSPMVVEGSKYDPNRDTKQPGENGSGGQVNPLALLVGPVVVSYDAGQTKVADIRPYIDEALKTVRSITGEVSWDYGKGVCTLDAPKAQGATGFLKKVGRFKLGDVEMTVGNDYATVAVVSMDALPLRTSRKVLVQVGTVARPAGWKVKPTSWSDKQGRHTGLEVVSYGKAPWMIVENDLSLTLSNDIVNRATAVSPNGEAQADVPIKREGGKVSFRMPADAMYVVLH